jgi:hypothetical protein
MKIEESGMKLKINLNLILEHLNLKKNYFKLKCFNYMMGINRMMKLKTYNNGFKY